MPPWPAKDWEWWNDPSKFIVHQWFRGGCQDEYEKETCNGCSCNWDERKHWCKNPVSFSNTPMKCKEQSKNWWWSVTKDWW